jgi:L-amino acid N-acyltransferase
MQFLPVQVVAEPPRPAEPPPSTNGQRSVPGPALLQPGRRVYLNCLVLELAKCLTKSRTDHTEVVSDRMPSGVARTGSAAGLDSSHSTCLVIARSTFDRSASPARGQLRAPRPASVAWQAWPLHPICWTYVQYGGTVAHGQRKGGMEIISAEQPDLPGILAIYNHAVETTTSVYTEIPDTLEGRIIWWRGRLAQNYPVLVARAEGEVLGFSSFADFRPWPGYLHSVENSVYVRHDVRGRGLGAALVSALIPRAEALGKHVMIAGIDADNAASIRLHERLGFERVAHFREVGWKFGRWLDLVFLQCRIGETVPEQGER